MTNDQEPTYDELKRRLADAEKELQVMGDKQAASIAAECGVLEARLAETKAHSDHVKKMLLTIRNIGHLIVSEDDPLRLVEKACANLTKTLGYLNAWIALLDDKAENVIATGESGLDDGFKVMNERLKTGRYPQCMSRALINNDVVVVKDPKTECSDCPLSRGYRGRAGLSRRLHHGGRSYGILSVSVPSNYSNNQEVLALFEEVTEDLAYALHKIEVARRLCESQRELQRAQALAHVGSWCFDLNSGKVTGSDETRRIYGLDEAELSIKRIQAIPLEQYRNALDHALRKLVEEGVTYDIEFQIRRPSDNAIRDIHSFAEYDADRNIVIGTIQDITERKRAEEATREAAMKLQEAVRATNVGLWDWDLATNKVHYSVEWKRQIGCEENEISDDFGEWERRIHPDDLEPMLAHMRRSIAQRSQQFRIEYRFRHKSGSYRWILGLGSVIVGNAGEAIRVVGSHIDITERKALEEQLRQAQKMDSIGRLAGGVAHDFNNMLSVILGNAELVIDKLVPNDPLYDEMQEIITAAKRSSKITRQLLAFARKQTITPQVLDLNETVEGMLKMLRRLIGENIELTWLPGNDLWPIRMDPSQVDQVLANLCVNARDAIPGVGKLVIETGTVTFDLSYCASHTDFMPGDFVLLAVSDSGCGMDRQVLSRLFEPFFTTKGAGKGTGLGLATVYGIVKQNNGQINVYSEPGIGTTFKIYLPRYESQATQSQKEDAKDMPKGRGETVLIVEDEASIIKITKNMLESIGYYVLAAKTPGEAIQLAETRACRIDLLLTDVIMSEMNGRELAGRLSAIYPQAKLLYMSGYTADVIGRHGVLDAGVHFIQKPFSLKAIAIKVREALGE